MELHNQIKKYRNSMNMSQEQLAEKVYVTRQTVSNWENNKNYPDIHSLLLLSSLFHISLDQLIKGDLEQMKEDINAIELQRFNRDGVIYTLLLILSIISVVPLTLYFEIYGLITSIIIWGVAMIFALRLEHFKKDNDIQTYREIVAFTEGTRLDELEKAKESGKRPYQKVLAAFISGFVTLAICAIMFFLLT